MLAKIILITCEYVDDDQHENVCKTDDVNELDDEDEFIVLQCKHDGDDMMMMAMMMMMRRMMSL